MNLTALIVQLISGVLGGYAAGNVAKKRTWVQSATLSSVHQVVVGRSGRFHAAWIERHRTNRLSFSNRRNERGARYASHWISKIQKIAT